MSDTKKGKSGLTPLMQQYFEIRDQYADTLLLFQVGDFYELFFDDAKRAAAFLGIALTKRGTHNGEPIALCGVPLHALEHYLIKLVNGGFRIAICDQLEPPKPGSIVKRGVTQVLTPGTLTDSRLLPDKSSAYLSSFFSHKDSQDLILISSDLLSGQLLVTVFEPEQERFLEEEVVRLSPAEILLADNKNNKFQQLFLRLGVSISLVKNSEDFNEFEQWLSEQFVEEQRKKITMNKSAYGALFQLYSYLSFNQPNALKLFQQIQWYRPEQYLVMDSATQRNLELTQNLQGSVENSLFALLDEAMTPMGSRVIKQWVLRPLRTEGLIKNRHDCVEYFVHNIATLQQLKEQFESISDLERVIGRMALLRGQQHDYVMLMRVLEVLPAIKTILSSVELPLMKKLCDRLGEYHTLHQLLVASINDDRSHEWLIKKGFDQQLDQLRDLLMHGNDKILELEKKEQSQSKINSLKIRYNQVQGYYIEVTKPNLSLVPDYFIQTQTLVGKVRFTTTELKSLEADLYKAKREVQQVEQMVYERVKQDVAEYITQLRKTAFSLAHLDALASLAQVSYDRGYVRPTMHSSQDIIITQGKHPLVSHSMKTGFVPNDTQLTDDEQLWIITGPNMGGKSTYLRQVALMCVMAQLGSFIPAKSAQLPFLDKLFTRIGASDNLTDGKSTFLVEMEETASICNRATQNSLVILDEVGRGTSTFDGLAIAHAVVEYIYKRLNARCLFATHYHELTLLAEEFKGIVCYHATSQRTAQGIVFLHQMVRGIADGSFGLDVAKLAGLPESLIERAKVVLDQLDKQEKASIGVQSADIDKIMQLESELDQARKRLALLDSVNYDDLSPKKAFDFLWELK
ncbi:DNA mismatch repair protein MutS [bacterium]|jgi:DNA mismatch repair protein MutS|nr:DNA mismatch repair protein MutS [bacterium]MBT5015330.1 DNA mismatch repair protein MutS [bacterium]